MVELDGVTVLVVEDEMPLQNLYSSWLEEGGAEARTASDAETALEKWDDDVDAVLLDRRLGAMSGDSVLEKARDRGLQTPVSMVTAVDPDFDLVEMEFDDYISKPIEEDEIRELVQDLITANRYRDSVREFIRVGVKLQKLKNENPNDTLSTHAEYQKLKKRFNELSNQLHDETDNLTDAEKKALIAASNKA